MSPRSVRSLRSTSWNFGSSIPAGLRPTETTAVDVVGEQAFPDHALADHAGRAEHEHLHGRDRTGILGRWPRRSSSTATPGTTTRSRSCSPPRTRRSSCGRSARSPATRRSRRRRPTRAGSATSPASPACRSSPGARIRCAARGSSPPTCTGSPGWTVPSSARRSRPSRARTASLRCGTCCGRAEPVTVVATGPLTNVAALLLACPDVAARIERVVFMGGSTGQGNVTPYAEFNIHADPEAADIVLHSGIPVTMCGLNVTHQALADEEGAPGSRRSAVRCAECAWTCSGSSAAPTGRSGASRRRRCTTRSRWRWWRSRAS